MTFWKKFLDVAEFGNEAIQWLGLFDKLPKPIQEQLKQRLPGFLGLSLEDERIFNGILTKLEAEKRKAVVEFLHDKCEDFQRNRFINIVAGMEVIQGRPTVLEKKFNKETKQVEEKKILGKDDEDLRLKFLEEIALYIQKNGAADAYSYCLAGRIILEDPFYQNAIVLWKESSEWFKKNIGEPLGISSLEELSRQIEKAAGAIEDATRKAEPYQGFFREAFWFLLPKTQSKKGDNNV